MKIVGINKRIDGLGRICIPKSMRELYNLNDIVELIVTTDGVLLRAAECYEDESKNEDIRED